MELFAGLLHKTKMFATYLLRQFFFHFARKGIRTLPIRAQKNNPTVKNAGAFPFLRLDNIACHKGCKVDRHVINTLISNKCP